jgi:tetratricopeptide (TPR) repeat protein
MKKGVIMKKGYLLLIAAFLFSLVLLCSCGDDGEDGGPSAQELIENGWAKFSAGDYSGAASDFNAALGLDPDANDAYLGLGWAELTRSNAGLAEDAFLTYTSLASGSNDARAGLALAYHAQDKFDDVVDVALEVLSADPPWSFGPDPEINHLDVALILAEAYYETGNYDQSLSTVQEYFDPQFNVDTSTDEGRAQLAAKLQSLYTG